ncbi:MAG TPA: HAMP domain-containing sensor histidine kinase [Puia sp.]|jgi:signal transduction histidine kinase|nr:HAMP domain-containing sensor histidine kinase [Puia sp.]
MSKPLEQRSTRSLLMWLPLVMLAGFVFLYILMRLHIRHMQEEQLKAKQRNVWNALEISRGGLERKINGEYDIVRGGKGGGVSSDHPRDTTIFAADGSGGAGFTYLTHLYLLDGVPYQVTTYTSSREFNHLLIKIFLAESLIFLLLLSGIVYINRRASGRLWTPFYETMAALGRYDVRRDQPLSLAKTTGVEEFDRLNDTLGAAIIEAHGAYQSQKQFTENAAHELQTPLAIIRSKVELLMEDAALTEDMAQLLADINEANERLSQMNKNLLLLTRIDNRQYPHAQTIYLSDLLVRLTGYYEEQWESEIARLHTQIEPEVRLVANPSLIEILLNNLLRNAVIHNIPGGYVNVFLKSGELVVENSGPVLEGDPQRLFERFRKGSEDSRTTGLGLALVRQICQLYRFEIIYQHTEGIHRLRLLFGQEEPN